MNDNPMPQDERELPEWLQRETDRIERETARDRLAIGLVTMGLIVLATIAINAWLRTQGFGA